MYDNLRRDCPSLIRFPAAHIPSELLAAIAHALMHSCAFALEFECRGETNNSLCFRHPWIVDELYSITISVLAMTETTEEMTYQTMLAKRPSHRVC